MSVFPGQASGQFHRICDKIPKAAQSSSVGWSPIKNVLSPEIIRMSQVISLFRAASWFDTVYNIVTR